MIIKQRVICIAVLILTGAYFFAVSKVHLTASDGTYPVSIRVIDFPFLKGYECKVDFPVTNRVMCTKNKGKNKEELIIKNSEVGIPGREGELLRAGKKILGEWSAKGPLRYAIIDPAQIQCYDPDLDVEIVNCYKHLKNN